MLQTLLVYVTSSDAKKIERAKSLGAIAGFNYREKNWADDLVKELGGKGVDLIFDGAAGNAIST